MQQNCVICNEVFEAKIHNQTMCSKPCVRIYRTAKQREYVAKNKVVVKRYSDCVICGTNFELAPKSSAKTCSKVCSKKQSQLRHAAYRDDPSHLERMKEHDIKHRNSEKKKEWREKNRKILSEKKNTYFKKKRKEDLNYRLLCVLRATVGRVLKKKKKNHNRSSYCTYTTNELKAHLESKFREGMTWENYGRLGWHIDHIKPLTAFTFFDENGNMILEEFRACMSLENLQPLWYDENIRKGGLRKMRTQ